MSNTIEEQEIIDAVVEYRRIGCNSPDLFDRMRKAEDFKNGNQWDESVKAANEAKGKFCLTIPLLKPIVNQITGVEIENPRDVVAKPDRGGTAVVAKILTALAKHATSSEQTRFEMSQDFEDGISTGQGVIGIFINKETDPKHANLDIRRLNQHTVMFDPACKSYNINDAKSGCKYVVWEEPVDREWLEIKYPKKAEELKASYSTNFGTILAGNIQGIISWLTGSGKKEDKTGSFGSDDINSDDFINRYRLIHTWYRKPKKCYMWYDVRESEMNAKLLIKDDAIAAAKKATKEDEEAAKLRKEQILAAAIEAGQDPQNLNPQTIEALNKAGTPVFEMHEVIVNVMHHNTRVGNVFIDNIIDELNGVDAFPLVPYWAYFNNGYKSGVIEDLIGTQEELNYIHSQSLNITKNIANSGLIINGGVGTEQYQTFLEAHAGEDGIILDKSKAGGGIEKIQPSQVPTAHFTLEQSAMQNMRLISNQRTEVATQDTEPLSGKAIALKQKSQLQGSGSMFMRWNYSFIIFANLLINIIRHNDIYSEDEIEEIVEKEDLIDPEMFAKARQLVIETFAKQGINMPEPPAQPNILAIRSLQLEEQKMVMMNLKKELDAYNEVQSQIDAQAAEMAKAMLLDEIHNIRKGHYSCTVILSPSSDTMRAARAAELFGLNQALREAGEMPIDGEELINATDIDPQVKERILAKRKERMSQPSLQGSQMELNKAKAAQIASKVPQQMQGVA
jgi:hypothetical protein